MPSGIMVFPQPSPGWSWPVTRTPKFSQRIQRANSGRELHTLDQVYPTWEWTLTYEILRDKNDLRLGSQFWNYNELRALMGFYGRMLGTYSPFLFFDPTDGQVTGQRIAFGDGAKTTFQLLRDLGTNATFQPVDAAIVNCTTPDICLAAGFSPAFKVYVDGVEKSFPGDWTPVAHTGFDNAICALTFTTPPAAGKAITVDMTFLWPCRFVSDSNDFENFLVSRWGVRQLKFASFLMDSLA